MGGVEPIEAGAAEEGEVLLRPDTANNNTFDAVASEYFYRRVQEIRVPLVVVSRWAACAAPPVATVTVIPTRAGAGAEMSIQSICRVADRQST